MDNDLLNFFKPPQITEAKCVLCVQPHSDDNEIGMGATIKKLASMGCEIHYLTVTDGRLGTQDKNQDLDKLAKIRKQEAIDAGTFLGATHFHFFDYKDGTLKNPRKLSYRISELIRTIKCDFVFVCDPNCKYEAHLDHLIVGQAVSQAVISCSLAKYPEKTKTEPFEVSAIGYYFSPMPNTFIDITEFLNDQFQAMEIHKSQLSGDILNMFKGYLINQYKNYATEENSLYSQGFKLLRPMHLHCVTEVNHI
ncbi:MAG: PIG-L family deacetylase [Sphaerochaetaceae bacterium]|nr:PIG-L family deacetylase [Sphaerochaetaceae bacterium]MDC7237900.1 PIG-L family deacetylase [Sphaerochaetaceae bacterium]MDC7250091.1 PIG-L family deacetylase [Sphaerochaetaceae bacterium]